MKTHISLFVVARYCGIYAICIFLFHLPTKSFGQSDLPPALDKLFFQDSKFNNEILIEIPIESSLSIYEQISKTPDIYSSGMVVAYLPNKNAVENYNPYLLSFLVKTKLAKIETKVQTTHYSRYGDIAETYNFIFYSDLEKKSIEMIKVDDFSGVSVKPYLKLGHRKLISITYKNQYEDSPLGMKRTFYSIVFSYKLINDLGALPAIAKVYTGKGKAFLDPDDGTWKLVGSFENLGLTLEDYGANDYMKIIQSVYQPFDFEKNKLAMLALKEHVQDSLALIASRNQAIRDSTDEVLKFPDKLTYSDGSFFKGQLISGSREGYGYYKDLAGNVYEGEWKNNMKMELVQCDIMMVLIMKESLKII
jgi:hypothetical protein